MALSEAIFDLTHGSRGLVFGYGLIATGSLGGLIFGRATISKYLLWPVSSLVTFVIVGLLAQFLLWVFGALTGIEFGTVGQLIYTVIFFLLGGFLGGVIWSAPASGAKTAQHSRGTLVIDGAQAQWVARKAKSKGANAEALTIAGIPMPAGDETKHLKVMGTTGSGKSTAIREYVHTALSRGDRAVIADPDGGYLSRFYDPARGDIILNPFDARSVTWDLFAEIRQAYDIDQLADALIPDKGTDVVWSGYARTLFASATRQAHTGGMGDLGGLYDLLTGAPKEDLKAFLQGTPAAPFLEEGSEKLFGGTRSTLADAIKCLDYIRAGRGDPFSVREWIRTGKGVLFLPYQADQIASLRTIISTWLRLAISQTLSLKEGDCRTHFVIDELDALGAISGLPDALARLRKFGGRVTIGFQTAGVLTTLYGPGIAQAIIENASNALILRCASSDGGGTAQLASRIIGNRDIIRTARSVSREANQMMPTDSTESDSQQFANEPAVLPAEIEQLPDRVGYLKFASRPTWMRLEFPIYDLPIIAEPFVPVQGT